MRADVFGHRFAYTVYMFPVIETINQDILLFLYHAGTSSPFASMLTIFFAEWLPFLLIAFAVAYELFIHEWSEVWRPLTRLFCAPFIAFILTEILKHVIHAPRPFADGLNITPLVSVSDAFGSMPSAHAAFFSALAVVVCIVKPRIGKWYFAAALLIGVSRIAAGVHFPSDILAGFTLGVSVAFFIEMFRHLIFFERKADHF